MKMPEPTEGVPNPFADAMGNMLRTFQSTVDGWGEDFAVYAEKIRKWAPLKLYSGFTDVAEPMKCG